jgi:biotin-(acetyl-CoA carboxylase) ligase
LKNDLSRFKDETNEKIQSILDQLSRKAEKQDLHLLEAKLLEKLNEMLQKFLGMFADKKDTNKRLSHLEKNVRKSIYSSETILINILF